jgi:hypothetical protein
MPTLPAAASSAKTMYDWPTDPARGGMEGSMRSPDRRYLRRRRRFGVTPHLVIVSDACRTPAQGLQIHSVSGASVFPNNPTVVLKGEDPALAVYAAYSYYEMKANDRLQQINCAFLDQLDGYTLFDVALLAGYLSERVPRHTVVPFLPLWVQGGDLLGGLGIGDLEWFERMHRVSDMRSCGAPVIETSGRTAQ